MIRPRFRFDNSLWAFGQFIDFASFYENVENTRTLVSFNKNVTLNCLTMPVKEAVKYLGVHLDRRLTWKPHIKAKQTQLKAKTKKMYWLLGRRSQLSLENKIRIY